MSLLSLGAVKLLPFLKFGIIPATSWLWIRFGPKPDCRVVGWALWFVAVISTLFLLLSIPTGSVDISDLWRFLAFAAVPALLIVAFRQSLRLQRKLFRIPALSASTIALFASGSVFVLLCLGESACTRRAAPIYSPNGGHLALVRTGLGGALDADYVSVAVRTAWMPVASNVYTGPEEPVVRLLDDYRPLVRYHTDSSKRDGPTACRDSVGTIQVICEETR